MVHETWTTTHSTVTGAAAARRRRKFEGRQHWVTSATRRKRDHPTDPRCTDRGWLRWRSHCPLAHGKRTSHDRCGCLATDSQRSTSHGDWPSGQPGDVLLRTLEATLADLPEGETKSHIRTLLAAARDVGTEVLAGVVTNVVKSTMGLP